jgi:hypothetical protein
MNTGTKPLLPAGEGGGEGNLKFTDKIPLILSFSRREKELYFLASWRRFSFC